MHQLRSAFKFLLAATFALACARPASPSMASRPWAAPGASGPEAEIYRIWMRRLAANDGRYAATAAFPSPDWLASEQQEWPLYDLAGTYLPDGATPEVLSIVPEPGVSGEYRVVTAFHAPDEYNTMRSKLIRMTVFADRAGGRWVFGNALPRLTRDWRHETVGPITYVLAPGDSFDRARATRASAFIDSLAAAFHVPRVDHVTYYLTSSDDEVFRILGLETDRKWGPVGGAAQPVNHLIFSGIPALGEEYRHELVHLVLTSLMDGHPSPVLISEGVPTWLGGTTGMTFPVAARGLAQFLVEHPAVTLDSLLAPGAPVIRFYPAGAVFADMTFRRGGTEAVKALFDIGQTPLAFQGGAERLFKEPWPSIAADWRTHALSFLPRTTP